MSYIDRSKVFAHLSQLAGWQNGSKPAPVTVEWDLSNRCVLGCQDCHFAHTHTRGPWVGRPRRLPMAFEGTGDLADPLLVKRTLFQMRAEGVQAVIWSGGGEPSTHPSLREIVGQAGLLGLQQGMYTLGGLLTPELAEDLGGWLSWVVVSLDADEAEGYSREKGVPASRFEAACAGIHGLVAAQGAVVGVSFLLHGGNWQRAGAMLQRARTLGAGYACFRPAIRTAPDAPGQPLDDRGWITDAWGTLQALAGEPDVEIDPARFAEYRDWAGHGYASCYGIRLTTTITPDGRVWVCPQRRGVQGSALGDLRREDFATIWGRHPGRFAVDEGCRAMCRLHLMNGQLAEIYRPRAHAAFV